MTLFHSLKDLCAVIVTLNEEESKGFILGYQELTSNPEVLNTLVVYYSHNGVLYHESSVENLPINREKIIIDQELFKALDIENKKIKINKKPDIEIENFPYEVVSYTELLKQVKELKINKFNLPKDLI